MSHILRCSGYDIVKKDIIRGQDCYLFDVHDNKYIDFEAGVWCAGLGHNHPRINQAMKSQIDQIIHLGFRCSNDLIEETAEEILETVELSDGKCIFLSSGSEAVEFGVQIARRITQKPLLITLSGSYLAAYGSAWQENLEEWYCFDWSECSACSYPDECDSHCPHLREIPLERIGGLVFEPGSTSGLVKLPPIKLVQTLENMVKQQHGLIVVDEVTTGLGRSGAWYGFLHYILQPDIIAIGKGIGNGYPVSAVLMRNDIADRLEHSEFRYAQSHQNDPLGCAIVKEVIKVIREDNLVTRSNEVGARLLSSLEQLRKRHSIIKEVRGRGLMIAIEFKGSGDHFSLALVYRELLERGFLLGYKPAANLLRLYPALIIKEDDIESMVSNLDEVLGRLA